MSGLAAVLIDLDGTLVDTARTWQQVYRELARELGVSLSDDFWAQAVGRSMRDSLRVFGVEVQSEPAPPTGEQGEATEAADPDLLVARLDALATERMTAADAGRDGWDWLPGAWELLTTLRAARSAPGPDGHCPATALVTSSWRPFTSALLASTSGGRSWPEDAFDAVVCGDDVPLGKPAPDGYLMAAELLQVEPAACLVVEDSPTGVAAAEAAGMVVLAVPAAVFRTVPPTVPGAVPGGPVPVGPGAGRAVRHDLRGLSVGDLAALHARLRSGGSA